MKDDDTKNPTESLSETSSEAFLGPKDFLGPKELQRFGKELVLLRVEKGIVAGALASKLKVSPYEPEPKSLTHSLPPLILGPFLLDDIQTWVAEGLLPPTDFIQRPYDRWRMLVTVFPELSHQMTQITDGGRPDTQTLSLGGEGSFGSDDPGGGIRIEGEGPRETESGISVELQDNGDSQVDEIQGISLKLDDVDGEPSQIGGSPKLAKVPENNPSSGAGSLPKAMAGAGIVGGAAATVRIKLSEPRFEKVRKIYFEYDPIRFSFLVFLLVVVSAGSFWMYQKANTPDNFEPEKSQSQASSGGLDFTGGPVNELVPESWPPNLRPLDVGVLLEDSDPIVAKIRPVLLSYQRGLTRLSQTDEALLKKYAQAGTSSWEGRRLASNQLAVFYTATNRVEEASRFLTAIYTAVPSDPATLLNLSLISFISGDYIKARELAESALRLSGPDLRWIAQSLWGLIVGSGSARDPATAGPSFEKALENSSNNGLVVGLWIRSLTQGPQNPNLKQLRSLVQRALWSDPDRMLDSPIPAPFGGHILQAESLTGFEKVIDFFPSTQDLAAAHRSYMRWLDPRNRLNPLSTRLEDLQGNLISEGGELSRVLYGFTLAKSGKYEESSRILTETLEGLGVATLTQLKQFRNSWPWTLAGDVLFELRQWDRSKIYYERALEVNPNDVSAVWGMALYYRQTENFVAAEQKLQETLALDPGFIPARLRRTRSDWHRRVEGE